MSIRQIGGKKFPSILMGVIMKIRFLILSLILLLALPPWAFSFTPNEVFEDGRRAFLLGHWTEADAQFQKFLNTWPAHALANRALYFETLSKLRKEREIKLEEEFQKIASLSNTLRFLKDNLPNEDFSEMEIALRSMKRELEHSPASAPELVTLSPDLLLHALRRGWAPDPEGDPFGTLSWIRGWKSAHSRDVVPPALSGTLELMRAKALWRFLLSPLPARHFADILKTWGELPFHDSLLLSLKKALQTGDSETKRQAALLAVSVEYAERWRFPREDSEWMRYLKERGIHESEAWAPK